MKMMVWELVLIVLGSIIYIIIAIILAKIEIVGAYMDYPILSTESDAMIKEAAIMDRKRRQAILFAVIKGVLWPLTILGLLALILAQRGRKS